jgi:hemerythrin superfamily protein
MADVFKMLESDHRQVERLLESLSSSSEGSEREQLVQKLTAALTLHMKFEESSIYPLLADVNSEQAEEANIEHGLARDGLSKLSELMSQPGFGAAVEMLKGGISHHVEDEEGEVFPELRKAVGKDTQQELLLALRREKQQAGLLRDDLDDASKDELLEMARDAGIEGRSNMSKEQLRDALASV